MTGLLKKDWYILLEMKRMIVLILLIAVLLAFGNPGGETFVVSYVTFVAAIMALTTITQDESGKGISFLMTMPVTREKYVQEKYLLGSMLGFFGWLFSFVVIVAALFFQQKEITFEFLWSCLIYLPILLMVLALMIPVQLKFGGDRGRIVIIVVVALGIVSVMLFLRTAEILHWDLSGASDFVYRNQYLIYGLFILGFLAVLWISYRISLKVMRNKEL